MNATQTDWAFVDSIVEPLLLIAPPTFLSDIRRDLTAAGVGRAINEARPGPVFNWMMPLIQMQGISDRAAATFAEVHGLPTWTDIEADLAGQPPCRKLQGYWKFEGCGFRRNSWTCAEPQHLSTCPLPQHRLRKGILNQAAYSLFFFLLDVCEGDFGGWIDQRLDQAQIGHEREALLGPLRNVVGVSDKLWSMILADLLLGCDPRRERWVAVGATFVAVDTLVHAFLQRTGILARLDAEHPYGDRCYGSSGCADILTAYARRINARDIVSDLPAYAPRFVQHAIWRYCSESELNICNERRVGRGHCSNWCCPASPACTHIARGLGASRKTATGTAKGTLQVASAGRFVQD